MHRTFKIYPENKSLFFRVYIFDTKQDMYDFDMGEDTKDYDAKFTSIDHYKIYQEGRVKKTPMSGFIYFFKGGCGGGIVSHEMFHATLAWARRKKMNFSSLDREEEFKDYPNIEKMENDAKEEEDMAWVMGNLVVQFYEHYYNGDKDYYDTNKDY